MKTVFRNNLIERVKDDVDDLIFSDESWTRSER